MKGVGRIDYWKAALRLLETVAGLNEIKTQIQLAKLARTMAERATGVGAPLPFRG